MKKKPIKLTLNKQTIAKLDNELLKGVKGGKELQGQEAQFLSIFHCSYTPKCFNDTATTSTLTFYCNTTINLEA